MSLTLPSLPRALLLAALASLPACSVERYAVDRLADALAGSGTTFASDDDPELVREAVPSSLKLVESVLAETPGHAGLLLAAASGFTQYAWAFVQQDADRMEKSSLARATELRARARKLYLRARGYGMRGLEVAHPGFGATLREDREAAVRRARVADVPQLYWTAAAWAGAIDLSKDDPETVADLPIVQAMMDRALELDESWGGGSIHTFLIRYELSRPGGERGAEQRARDHYARAVELSGGRLAGPKVALAEAVSIRNQNRAEFESLLGEALAIDVDERPEWRLQNLILQRRARWLLGNAGDYFLETDPP